MVAEVWWRNRSGKKLRWKRSKWKKSKGKIFYHCKLICASPKHLMHGCLRCLKILYVHNCWNLFFVPEPLWNSDNQKLSHFTIDLFYRNVISPIAVKLLLLPFSSHCSTQNTGFSDSGYVIKPPQPSSAAYGDPPFTGHLLQITFTTNYYIIVGCKVPSTQSLSLCHFCNLVAWNHKSLAKAANKL